MKVKPKKKSSYSRALLEARAELKKATDTLKQAQARVAECQGRIPQLKQVIAALECKVSPLPPAVVRTIPAGPKPNIPQIPPELAKYVGPQDLSGMGSVPPPAEATGPQSLSDDELLPDADGDPVVPE
jgi:hypothetical protein